MGCKWVYKIKCKADGKVECYKVKLVGKEYNQVEGIDYHETFTAVAKHVTIYLLLATTKWHLHQLDINNAFLNGHLNEQVFMSLPPRFELKGETRIC